MACRAAVLYDPATAVNRAATAVAAMAALDSTNLRLTFTAPASGRVLVRLGGGAVTGSATPAQLLLGVIEAAPTAALARGRVAPQTTMNGPAAAATMAVPSTAWVVTGLTAGTSYTWDAAVGVEVAGAAGTVYRYGGPNDATTTNAAGGIFFEIWDA